MQVKIMPNDKGSPAGKLADAELHFTDGPLAGLKLLGFAVCLALLSYFVVAVMYRRPARTAATVAIALGAGFELVFPVALGVALPTGILGF